MSTKRIIVLGPPGSGKDTQADRLSMILNIPKISIGDLLRAEVRQHTALGKEIEPYLQRGEIPPGNIGTRVFKEALDRGQLSEGYILVGFPRSLDALERYLAMDTPTHIVVLDLEKDTSLARMRLRDREDDRDDERTQARYERFTQMEVPVIQRLRELATIPIFFIDAHNDIEFVQREIIEKLKS